MGNNTSAPVANNAAKKNTMNTNNMALATSTNNMSTAPASTNNMVVTANESESTLTGGRRRGRSTHRRRQSRKMRLRHRKSRGGAAGLTLRYTPNRPFTPTGPTFSMNNPTFSPSASRRPSVIPMSNEEMSAYPNNISSYVGINENAASANNRASFVPRAVRKSRKANRKNRKNRRNRKH